ncbi:MAG: 4-hydroxy-tetrahydrodipicolinate synthase [Ferruginibacter sp.]|nr:4-hydroxy-tetrahydrodipicolinate synthase [Ferruginibacter sp.]
MNLRKTLTGTGVAIVTPFAHDLSIDYTALGNLIDYIINNGVNYIVTLGTTGETPVLRTEEKKEIIHFTQKHIAGRIPMVIGIGGNDTASVINDLQTYPLDAAVAVLSASPYYNKPSQEGIYQHYKALAAASPKPIILYNVPGRTGRNMTAATTLRLAQVDNIEGIKEASNDIQQVIEILKGRHEDFFVTSGDDDLVLPEMACGMDGVISVAANAFPKAFSNMVNHCLKNEFPAAVKINNDMLEVYRLLFAENNPSGVKAFLAEMNIIQNYLRLPGVPLSDELHGQIKDYLLQNNLV